MTVRTQGGKPSVAYERIALGAERDRRLAGHGAVGLRHPRHGRLDGQCLPALLRDCPPSTAPSTRGASVRVSNGRGAGLACGK